MIRVREEIAGHFWARIDKDGQKAFGYDIYIQSKFRGLGIGRISMNRGREILRSHNIEKLEICVFSENLVAINLYKSMGFEQVKINKEKKQIKMGVLI